MKTKNVLLGFLIFSLPVIVQAVTIKNAGYEKGFSHWNKTDRSAMSTESYSGSHSGKISDPDGRLEQKVTLLANTDYVLAAYVKDNGIIGINLGISTKSSQSSTKGWNQITVNFNSGSAISGDIFAAYNSSEGRFDDFTLTTVTTKSKLPVNTAFGSGTSDSNYSAHKAIDNDTSWHSRWAAHDNGNAVNLILQLGQVKEITDIGISWGKGDSRTHNFEIYARPNENGKWVKVYENISSGKTTDIEMYDIDNIDARQIRIKGRSNSAGSKWTNITEVKLYGINGGGKKENTNCEAKGLMLYNGSCAQYSEVFKVQKESLDNHSHIHTSSSIGMTFNSLATKYVTINGKGWKHELKVKSKGGYRVGMTELYENFKAKITAKLSDGAKTIVTQHYTDNTHTLTKLYISDLDDGNMAKAPDGSKSDGIAMNGIFDVYIRLAKKNSTGSTKHLLTTIRSGESFDFEETNDHGKITIKINGQPAAYMTVNDDSPSYFKFGNYQQAQNPETGVKLKSGNRDGDYDALYTKYFKTSEITFTNMSYTRTVD